MLEFQKVLSDYGFGHADIALLTMDKNWLCSEFASKEINNLVFELARIERQLANSADILDKKILQVILELFEMQLERAIRKYIDKGEKMNSEMWEITIWLEESRVVQMSRMEDSMILTLSKPNHQYPHYDASIPDVEITTINCETQQNRDDMWNVLERLIKDNTSS